MMDADQELAKPTVNSAVREKLYLDIMTGRLPAGRRLTINELSKRYNTSSTPVRSALLELQGKGLVTALPHRGAAVRLINAEYLHNIHEIRTAIIRLIIPKCVMYVSNADIEKSKELEAEFKLAVAAGDVGTVLEKRSAFYLYIFRLSRNSEAVDIIDRSWSVIDLLRLRYGVDSERLKHSSRAHEQLVDALSRRDAETALDAILTSNNQTVRDLLERMEKGKTRDR